MQVEMSMMTSIIIKHEKTCHVCEVDAIIEEFLRPLATAA
jgi:hypothetical protein